MHFGVSLPNNQGVESVRELAHLAAEAEGLGYESVWVSEHLLHAAYVAERLGDRPYHEPLTVLTAAAMCTERVALGTSVLVLPWHHPVRLAKVLASLDVLSAGRVILGVGVALTRDEYAALGVPFERRGEIADEMLVAMKALWTEDVPRHEGKHYRFGGLRFSPKPVQKPHMPIWVGGSSEAAMRRVARAGDGWHPLGLSPDDLGRARPRLAEHVGDRVDTLPIAVRIAVDFRDEPWERPIGERKTGRGTPEELLALVRAYEAAGATHLIVDAASRDLPFVREVFARFRTEVAEKLN